MALDNYGFAIVVSTPNTRRAHRYFVPDGMPLPYSFAASLCANLIDTGEAGEDDWIGIATDVTQMHFASKRVGLGKVLLFSPSLKDVDHRRKDEWMQALRLVLASLQAIADETPERILYGDECVIESRLLASLLPEEWRRKPFRVHQDRQAPTVVERSSPVSARLSAGVLSLIAICCFAFVLKEFLNHTLSKSEKSIEKSVIVGDLSDEATSKSSVTATQPAPIVATSEPAVDRGNSVQESVNTGPADRQTRSPIVKVDPIKPENLANASLGHPAPITLSRDGKDTWPPRLELLKRIKEHKVTSSDKDQTHVSDLGESTGDIRFLFEEYQKEMIGKRKQAYSNALDACLIYYDKEKFSKCLRALRRFYEDGGSQQKKMDLKGQLMAYRSWLERVQLGSDSRVASDSRDNTITAETKRQLRQNSTFYGELGTRLEQLADAIDRFDETFPSKARVQITIDPLRSNILTIEDLGLTQLLPCRVDARAMCCQDIDSFGSSFQIDRLPDSKSKGEVLIPFENFLACYNKLISKGGPSTTIMHLHVYLRHKPRAIQQEKLAPRADHENRPHSLPPQNSSKADGRPIDFTLPFPFTEKSVDRQLDVPTQTEGGVRKHTFDLPHRIKIEVSLRPTKLFWFEEANK
jgi:hypothetical protein